MGGERSTFLKVGETMSDLLTSGEVARRLGVPQARLNYALERSGIQEQHRAGILRLYSQEQVPEIEAALNAVRSRKGTRQEGGTATQ